MGSIGQFALMVIPILIVYGMTSFILGIVKKEKRWISSGKRAIIGIVFLATIASAILIYLLVTDNFNYQYVISYSSTDMDLFYKIAAFWGGNAGSMLLWFWMLSIFILIVAYTKHKDSELMLPYVSSISLFVALFFSIILLFVAPPFELATYKATEGNGLNPLLQNPGMATHPITLYLGYVGFTIPFSYALAALWLRKADGIWLKVTRKWTIISWLFLSMGILYGARWSYVELGWGGYWAWDPVENAAFMPWLVATAFLHSAMIQEKKGMFKKWNVILIVISYLLVLFGVLLTRSGILWSVHSFSNGPIGAYFLAFIGILFVLSFGLSIFRWSDLKTEHQFEAAVSKESSFLLNNLLLIGVCFTVFWGTIYPLISEFITGNKVMVGAPFFNRVSVPVFVFLILLMGICPLIAWRKSTISNLKRNFIIPLVTLIIAGILSVILGVRGIIQILSISSSAFVLCTIGLEFFNGMRARKRLTGEGYMLSALRLISQNRRRYGGYIVHIAIVIMAIGVTISSTYSSEVQKMVMPNEELKIGPYNLTFQELTQQNDKLGITTYADFLVNKNGEDIGVIRPEKIHFSNGLQPATEIAIYSTFTDDLYVVLAGWDELTGAAAVQVNVNPLVSWIWFGSGLLIVGSLIAIWPDRRRDTVI